MYENNDKDYETLARSNENLRDSIEGKLHEPSMSKSTENSNGNRDISDKTAVQSMD